MQRPDERRVHTEPTALLGGAAILLGFLAGLVVAWRRHDFAPVFDASTIPLGVALGAVVMFGVGQLDDLREVSPPAKIAGTVLSASILSIAGVSILFFRIPFAGLLSLSPDMSALLTVLWVIGMTTAINYIDGLDGLAAGIVGHRARPRCSSTASGSTTSARSARTTSARSSRPRCSAPASGSCPTTSTRPGSSWATPAPCCSGSSWPPPRSPSAATPTRQFSGQTFFFFAPLFIPLVILGVPIFDTAFSILRRARRGAGVTVADKDHLHHRLMRLGHGQRRSVADPLDAGRCCCRPSCCTRPTTAAEGDLYIPFAVAAAALVLYTMFGAGIRARGRGPRARGPQSG